MKTTQSRPLAREGCLYILETYTTNLVGRMELSADPLEASLPSIWLRLAARGRVFGKVRREIYHSSLNQVAAASGALIAR